MRAHSAPAPASEYHRTRWSGSSNWPGSAPVERWGDARRPRQGRAARLRARGLVDGRGRPRGVVGRGRQPLRAPAGLGPGRSRGLVGLAPRLGARRRALRRRPRRAGRARGREAARAPSRARDARRVRLPRRGGLPLRARGVRQPRRLRAPRRGRSRSDRRRRDERAGRALGARLHGPARAARIAAGQLRRGARRAGADARARRRAAGGRHRDHGHGRIQRALPRRERPRGHAADGRAAATRSSPPPTFALALRDEARPAGDVVATVGDVRISDAAANVVPGPGRGHRRRARADDRRRSLRSRARRRAWRARPASRSTSRRCTFDPPVPLSTRRAGRAARGRAAEGVAILDLGSGAGHDAGILAAAGVEAGMLFVRSRNGGVSHRPEELTDEDDIAPPSPFSHAPCERSAVR